MEQVLLKQSQWAPLSRGAQRLFLLIVLLTVEKLLLIHVLPGLNLTVVTSVGGLPVLFSSALLFFGFRRLDLAGLRQVRINKPLLLIHGLALACLAVLQHNLLSPEASYVFRRSIATSSWVVLCVIAIVTLTLGMIPPGKLLELARSLGAAWLYATLCTVAFVVVRHFGDLSWQSSSSVIGRSLQQATFANTRALLAVFYKNVIAFPGSHLLGTSHYVVEISWLCSGVEGLGLVAILLSSWLLYMRKELRVGRALLILPIALLATWLMNIVRLAMLIAIGDAGYPLVASNGFHAQAGWIFLNLLVLTSLLLVQRVRWFQREAGDLAVVDATTQAGMVLSHNATVIYLLPLTVILAASLVSQAVSSGFEWAYPLRLIAAAGALLAFRKRYLAMNWRFGIHGLTAGLVVGLFWLGLRMVMKDAGSSAEELARGLASLTPPERAVWIGTRVLATVTTVPIAEELAFRGFLARRIMTEDFEKISFNRLSLFSIAVNSAAFGVMHGRFWFAGIIAGVVFSLVAKLNNRIGEAVAAHATANLTIAIAALWFNNYSLW